MANKNVTITINTTTASGKKKVTNISYVNPEATNEKLKALAQKFISLTNESYVNIVKVTKESVI